MAILLGSACGEQTAPSVQTIDRETFISTYVDLRTAALTTEDGELDAEAVEEVLASHGVTSDDLLDFVTLRGTDTEYIRDVWEEIESRLNVRPEDTLPDPNA